MKPYSLFISLLKWVLALGLLSSGLACTPGRGGQGPVPLGDSEAVTGIVLNFENARVRCEFTQETAVRHRVECAATAVSEGSASEFRPISIAENLSLFWQIPERLSGAQVIGTSCDSERSGLTFGCTVELSEARSTIVEFALQLTEGVRQRRETDQVLLPFSVQSFGEVPHLRPYRSIANGLTAPTGKGISQQVETQASKSAAMGYQTKTFPASEFIVPQFLGAPRTCGEEIFFSVPGSTFDTAFIYKLSNGEVSLFAGTVNGTPEDSVRGDHRLRWKLSRDVSFDCHPEGLLVLDQGHLAKFTISGAVVPILEEPEIVGGKILAAKSGDVYVVYQSRKLARLSLDGTVTTLITEGFGVMSAIIEDNSGNLIIADNTNHKLFKLTPLGELTPFAGTGEQYPVNYRAPSDPPITPAPGDGGPALLARINRPYSLARSPQGEIFILEDVGAGSQLSLGQGNRIRKIDKDGNIHSVVDLRNENPLGLSYANANLLVAARENSPQDYYRLLQISESGEKSVFMGSAEVSLVEPLKGPVNAEEVRFSTLVATSFAPDGTLYAVDSTARVVWRFPVGSTKAEIFAGTGSRPASSEPGQSGPATTIALEEPRAVSVDPDGNVYIGDVSQIWKVDTSGNMTEFHRLPDLTNDTTSDFGIRLMSRWVQGKMYFLGFRALKQIDLQGTVSTFNMPSELTGTPLSRLIVAMAVSDNGTLYGMYDAGSLFQLTAPAGQTLGALPVAGPVIPTTTFPPTPTGFEGDGGPATQALFRSPKAVSHYPGGGLLIGDSGNGRLRILDPSDSGGFSIDSVYGGIPKLDCGTSVQKRLREGDVEDQVRASLSSVCFGKPMAIAVHDECESRKSMKIAVVQHFGYFSKESDVRGSTNLLLISRPCE